MKNIMSFIVAFAGLLLVNTSCEDFLSETPMDEISVDYIYTTAEGLEVGVNALYNLQRKNNFPEGYSDGLKANAFFMAGTDLGMTRTWHRPYVTNHTPSGFPDDKWTLPYQIIDRANAIITNAPLVEMEDGTRNSILAQARAIRGELYLDLIRMYDNILLDTIATTTDNAFDSVTYEVADPAAVYALIDEDLDFAIAHTDWNVDFGRYSKGTMRHIRGKSAMWQGKWTEAAAQFDSIVASGIYDLVDVSKVFAQDPNNSETLFAYMRSEALGGSDDLAGGGSTLFSSFFNNRSYELASGELIKSVENGGLSLGWSFPNAYLMSLYDQAKDARFETYYYPLTLYVNNPEMDNFGEALPAASYDDNFRRYHWSLKKFHDTEKSAETDKSYKSLVYYRYAETLLLGAEAHWRMDNENPTNATALAYINKVRKRAGLDDYTTFGREPYLEESARELAFEKNRWFLLKRMDLLVARQNKYYKYGSNSANLALEPMKAYMVRLPIPQSQIDLMGTFPQNNGY